MLLVKPPSPFVKKAIMKNLILLLSLLVFSLNVNAQSVYSKEKTKKIKKQEYRYCAKLKDGLLVMMEGDKELTREVVLANGTRIRPDASITKPDGSVIILEDGECVDESGNIFPAVAKSKAKNKTLKGSDKIPPQK